MKRKTYLIPVLFFLIVAMSNCTSPPQMEIYVATNGSDDAKGTKNAPVATLAKAIDLAKTKGISKIILAKGRYQLGETIEVDYNTGDSLKIVGENGVVISGGVEISDFKKLEGNLYVADVRHLLTEEFQNFRQLFKNGERLPRAQTPNGDAYFITTGQIEKYKGKVREWDFEWYNQAKKEDPEILTVFAFEKGDIKPEWALPFVEVMMHHSWETSYQTFQKIDALKSEAYMNNPAVWPLDFFGDHGDRLRYKLFNHSDFIDQAGEWMIDPEEGKLYYLAQEGEDVALASFILPVNKQLIKLQNASKVKFQNITFSYTDHYMGNFWSARNTARDGKTTKQQKNYPGFSQPQAAMASGEVIQIANSDSISFENCIFKGTGAYGIWISDSSNYISIKNTVFDDLGAGAIKIGEPKGNLPYNPNFNATHHNLIENCTIKNGGKIMPGAVGIWISQSHDNRIENNEIFNMPYTGINMGWNWKVEQNHTRDNLIKGNTIHDVMQTLTDGGGIYTLGILEGCILEANEIYNIYRPDDAAGSNSNGIFCDNKSQKLSIINNYIYNIRNAPLRFNDSHHSWMEKVEGNYFDEDYLPVKYNNNYNMDFDEDGFMRVVIEGNEYGVKDGAEWRAKYRKRDKS